MPDISLWPETHQVVREELGRALLELNRLNEAVTDLLALSRYHPLSPPVPLNLTSLVADSVSRWQRQAATLQRGIVLVAIPFD